MTDELIRIEITPGGAVDGVRVGNLLVAALRGGNANYLTESSALIREILALPGISDDARAELAHRLVHLFLGLAYIAEVAVGRSATHEGVDHLTVLDEIERLARAHFNPPRAGR